MRFVSALVLSSALLAACDDAPEAPADAGPLDAGPTPEVYVRDQQALTRIVVRGDDLFFDAPLVDSNVALPQVVYRYEPGRIAPVRVDGQPLSATDFRVAGPYLYFLDFDEDDGITNLLRIGIGFEALPEDLGGVAGAVEAAGDTVVWECLGPVFEARICRGRESFDQARPFEGSIGALAGDGEGAYWTSIGDNGETIVFAAPFGPQRVIVDQQIGIDFIALDQSFVYWASSEHGYVRRALKDGVAPEVLATNQGHIVALVVDGGEAFWSVEDNAGARIMRLRPGASEPETFVEDVSPIFAVGPDKVFFQDHTNIVALPR